MRLAAAQERQQQLRVPARVRRHLLAAQPGQH
jgi:hypothetical protein